MEAQYKWFGAISRWRSSHSGLFLLVLTIAVLTPFLAKPLNIDDPLFVWTAQQIRSHPGHPYSFYINWHGFPQPMWQVMQNPALMSYYLAMAAWLFGWSEVGFHFACLLPALAAILGTYRLAKHFCRWPLLAALIALFSPGFLVSCTTVMCDVAMLSFWVWAVLLWVEGLKSDRFWKLVTAGFLMGLAILTKYNAICILPLLAIYGWIEKRSAGRWLAFLLIPIGMACAHEWWTFLLYGEPHFWASTQFASQAKVVNKTPTFAKALITLTFTGACFAPTLFFSPFLLRNKTLPRLIVGVGILVALAVASEILLERYGGISRGNRIGVVAQIVCWSAGGIGLIVLVLLEVWQSSDSDSWLLALWMLGILTFTVVIYWMVNARVLLPMVPSVAILIARRLERVGATLPNKASFSLIACAALSFLVAQSDFQSACATQQIAKLTCDRYAKLAGQLWFEGHWGFQYYMQSYGAEPLNLTHMAMKREDILVVPSQNSGIMPPDPRNTTLLAVLKSPGYSYLATLDYFVGAGFYSSFWGPLPFAFGNTPSEKVTVYKAVKGTGPAK